MKAWALAAPAVVALAVMPLSGQQATFRTSVDLVRVDVLATDNGRPIRGLTAPDFELLDAGVPQQIDAVFAENQALDVFLVFDTSESVEGVTLEHLKEAANAVLDGLRSQDRAELLTFSHAIRLGVGLTSDVTSVRRAVAAIEARGATSLLDALYLSLIGRDPSPNRSMILVFSDGQDNRSWLSSEQVREVARATESVIYAVAFEPGWAMSVGQKGTWSQAAGADERLLGDVARATGGQLVLEEDSKRLKEVFLGLLAEMRARYVLTYYPRGVPQPGWHPLRVRLRNRSGRISARAGYIMVAR
jgi:VWFA-related protein